MTAISGSLTSLTSLTALTERGPDALGPRGSPPPQASDLRLVSIDGDTVVLEDVRTGERITGRVGRSPAARRRGP
jgi:hypothetical protein